MTRISSRPVVLLLAASAVVWAQQTPVDPPAPPANGGWHPAAPAATQDPQPATRDAYGQMTAAPAPSQAPAAPQAAPPPAAQPVRPPYGLPPQVTMKAATFVTMRINQGLASNHNKVGDTFTGSLTQPIVIDGIVLAQRGQIVYGRVVEADKVKGVHRLGVELTGLTLADGSQVAVHSQLVSRQGPTMPGGMQAGIITSTTAGGAAIGAIAGGGIGAGVGAGVGAIAGIAGVLASKNRPSVIFPETMLTFQTQTAVVVNLNASTGAFRYVAPDDYTRPVMRTAPGAPGPRPYAYGPGYGPGYAPGYGPGYAPAPYPYPYPYWGGWGWWGPSVFIGGGYRYGGFRRW